MQGVFAAVVKRKPVAETFDFLSRDGALGAHLPGRPTADCLESRAPRAGEPPTLRRFLPPARGAGTVEE